ncbi:MFS transporter [Streptomyces sp. NPDC054770]
MTETSRSAAAVDSSAHGGGAWGRIQQTLGIPDVSGHGRLLAAVVIDTVGVGAFLPLSFLYFTLHSGLDTATVGAMVSAASVAALFLGLPAGWLADRFAPRTLLVVNNVVVAAGYALFPVAHHAAAVFAVVFVVMATDRVYWAAWPKLVSSLATPATMDPWFAFTETVKNACMGLGAIAGTLLLAGGGIDAAGYLLLVDVVSSVAAAVVMMTLRPHPSYGSRNATESAAGTPATPGSWARLLKDRPLTLFIASQAGTACAWILPTVVLPFYYLNQLHLPADVAVSVFTLSTVIQVLFQSYATKRLSVFRRRDILLVSHAALLATIGVLVSLQWVHGATRLVLAVGVGVLLGLATMAYVPAANSVVALAAAPGVQGRALSFFQTAQAAAVAVAPALVGQVLTRATNLLWIAMGLLIALGALGSGVTARLLPGLATGRPAHPHSTPAEGNPQ